FEYAENKDPQTGQMSVRTFRNGQPVVNMKVPLNVLPDQRYSEGRAQLYVGPGEKDLLNAAIAAAGGNPAEPPPLGSMIRATKTGQRPNRNGGQSAVRTFEYWPPEVAQGFAQQLGIPYPDLNTPKPAPKEAKHALPEAPAAAAPASAGPAVQQQAAPMPPAAQPPAPPAPPAGLPPAPPVPAQQLPQPPAGMPPAPAPATPAQQLPQPPPAAPAVPGAGAVPADPNKHALLMQLTGQQAPPAA
ncbi:MAG: hypothetical protein JOY78_03080, partial [Pseudonocardia sp.]|nr:hypothetical protein [Pseudonocardia sp.]